MTPFPLAVWVVVIAQVVLQFLLISGLHCVCLQVLGAVPQQMPLVSPDLERVSGEKETGGILSEVLHIPFHATIPSGCMGSGCCAGTAGTFADFWSPLGLSTA